MPSIHPRMSPLSFFHRSWFLYDTIDCNEGMGVIDAPSSDTCVENAGTAALQVMHIFLQIAKGLQYVHACGLIHRDLKPANCFLMGEGTVKVGVRISALRSQAFLRLSVFHSCCGVPVSG